MLTIVIQNTRKGLIEIVCLNTLWAAPKPAVSPVSRTHVKWMRRKYVDKLQLSGMPVESKYLVYLKALKCTIAKFLLKIFILIIILSIAQNLTTCGLVDSVDLGCMWLNWRKYILSILCSHTRFAQMHALKVSFRTKYNKIFLCV